MDVAAYQFYFAVELVGCIYLLKVTANLCKKYV